MDLAVAALHRGCNVYYLALWREHAMEALRLRNSRTPRSRKVGSQTLRRLYDDNASIAQGVLRHRLSKPSVATIPMLQEFNLHWTLQPRHDTNNRLGAVESQA